MPKLSDIFDIWYGVNLEVVNCSETDNTWIPFVSRTSEKNGIATYVERLDDIEPNPAFTLSIAGSWSVLSTFFHEYEYYSGRDLYIAKPKIDLSKQEMLYYCTVIEANKYRYSYGRQANKTLKDISVPSPEQIPTSVKNYQLDERFPEKPISDKKLTLETDKWKWFRYDEIFDVVTGKWPTTIQDIENNPGDTPFVSTIAWNNWLVIKFDWDSEHLAQSITVANDGSVWSTFYQSTDFSASYKVNVIRLKNHILSKHIGMFLITLIEKEKYRYAYGRKFGLERMKQTKIKLPATPSWDPHWQWMEEYIKGLPYSASI